jgi:hypothetical protein
MDPKNIMAQLVIMEQKQIKQLAEKVSSPKPMNTLQKTAILTVDSVNQYNVQEQHKFTLLKPSTTFRVGIETKQLPHYNFDNYESFTIKNTTSHLFWRPAPTSRLFITEPHIPTGGLTVNNNNPKFNITIAPNKYIQFKYSGKLIIGPNKYLEFKDKREVERQLRERERQLVMDTKIKKTQKIINALKYEIRKNNLHRLNEVVAEKCKDLRAVTGKEKGFMNKFAWLHKKYTNLKKLYENDDEQLKKTIDKINRCKDKAGMLVQYLIDTLKKIIGQFAKYRQNVNLNRPPKTEKERRARDQKISKQVKQELNQLVFEARMKNYKYKENKCDENLAKLENRWDLNQQEYDKMKETINKAKAIAIQKQNKLIKEQKQSEDAKQQ